MIKQLATHSPEQLEHLSTLFRLLSDRTRLNLLMLLANGEKNVTTLCESLNLPQPTVSHHLGLLRMGNIISNRRDGKQVFYSLDSRVDVSNSAMHFDGMEMSVSIRKKD